MNTGGISWIITGLAILIILISFLFGLKRGLKKSSNRLLLIIISAILALFLTKAITGIIMDTSLIFIEENKQAMSINQIINNKLNSTVLTGTITLANFTLTTSAFVSLISGLVNLFVFVVLFLVFQFISWIIYLIIMREKKYTEEEKIQLALEGISTKKHKWWGSLIGAVQGIFICIIMFVPISCLSGVVKNINSKVSATNEKQQTIIEKLIPEQYQSYLTVFENSVYNKMIGWTSIDKLFSNYLTTTKIQKVKVSLNNEMESINNLYKNLNKNGVVEAIEKINISNYFENLTNNETNQLLTDVFKITKDSAIIKFALVDISNTGAKELKVEQTLEVAKIDWDKESNNIVSSLSNIINSMKPIAVKTVKGELKEITLETFNSENINYEKFGEGLDNLANISLMSNLYQPLFEDLISHSELNKFGAEIGFDFTKINISKVVWKTEMKSIGQSIDLAVKLKNNAKISELNPTDLGSTLKEMGNSELKDEFNNLIKTSLEEEYNLEIEDDDFNLIGNDELIDATTNLMENIQSAENNEALNNEKATNILNSIEAMPEDDATAQTLLDSYASSSGVEEDITISSLQESASLLKSFINNEGATAQQVANNLDANPNNITLLKFQNNTYVISAEQYSQMQTATTEKINKDAIMSLFVIEE